MEINGILYIEQKNKDNLEITSGSKVEISTKTDLQAFVHKDGDLIIKDGGDIMHVIVDGGKVFVEGGHIKCLDINDGSVMLDKKAKVDIIHMCDRDHVMLSFVNGADPNKFKVEIEKCRNSNILGE